MFNETFWVAVAFFIFIGMVFRPVGRLLGAALDKRAEKIKSDLDEAEKVKEDAQALLVNYQRKHKESTEEAEEIIARAKSEAERIVASAKARVEEEIAKKTEIALQKIAQAEAAVVNEIKNNAIDITLSAARSIIVENLDRESAEEIIHQAISGIDRKFH